MLRPCLDAMQQLAYITSTDTPIVPSSVGIVFRSGGSPCLIVHYTDSIVSALASHPIQTVRAHCQLADAHAEAKNRGTEVRLRFEYGD